MDPVSHAALGAALAQQCSRQSRFPAAVIPAVVGGLAPDLDLLIRSVDNPLLAIEAHRHFTHALPFAPLGALVCAAVVFPFLRAKMSFLRCYGLSLLGILSHDLLDACTSYGTLLFWPVSDMRIAGDLISAVDPLFTLPLVLGALVAIRLRRGYIALIGVASCALYLGFGQVQQHRATRVALELALIRGHDPERIDLKPSFANLLVWRSIYEHEGTYFIDAVRVGLGSRVWPGAALPRLEPARDFSWLRPQSQQWRDLETFDWFADGWLAVDPDNSMRILDLRYALVPNGIGAFWALQLDAGAPPDAHAGYVTMRHRTFREGGRLLSMILGRRSES